MKLVIVESPAKCSKIKGFLGDGWKVIASMGHIRALKSDLDAVGIDRDFEPQYEFMNKEKSKAIAGIKDAMKGCTQVYLAADDDREGEAIAYSVCLLLGLDPTATPRAVFREITKKAVIEAVTHPRRLDMNKINAQQARAMLDMLIGFTLSPLLWKYVSRGLSAGRCQTPALRLIADKEKTITDFKSALAWKVDGAWKDAKGTTKFPGALADELEDEGSAEAYMEIMRDNKVPFKVRDINVRPWKTAAPPPLITSTLQQQASAAFGMAPKVTMQVAQKLYEEGYITYMRTDSVVLSEDARTTGRAWIEETYGSEYLGAEVALTSKKPTAATKKKKEDTGAPQAQEAHEAIRPTEMSMREIPEADALGSQERRLYGLIWRRALQSLMADARGETKTIKYASEGDRDFDWVSHWRRTLFAGWKKLGEVSKIGEDDESDEEGAGQETWNETIKVGDILAWTEVNAKAVKSTAPGRYTEATLVRELEKKGIGRPSTYAAILAALGEKNYIEVKDIPGQSIELGRMKMTATKMAIEKKVEKVSMGGEKKKMVPTELGLRALGFLEKEFGDLIDYSFTANMEASLDKIAKGEEAWKNVLKGTWASYSPRYYHFLNKKQEASEVAEQKQANLSAKVKQFGEYKAVQSKKGPLLLKENNGDPTQTVFYGWPKGVTFSNITEEKALEFIREVAVQKEERARLMADNGSTSSGGSGAGGGSGSGALKQIGKYIFKNGPYGLYMYNDKLKTKTFISVRGVNIDTMTEKDADEYYKTGLEKKKAAAKRGGFRKKED